MAFYGDIFSNYPNDIKPYSGPYPLEQDDQAQASIVKQPLVGQEQEPVKWYNNPGFWAEMGKIGSALLSGSPRLKGLSAAGAAASEYHAGKQLDTAMTKMLSNIAAGKKPMEGFTQADTRGLTPAQVENINKVGLSETERLTNEKYKDIDKQYKEALIGDIAFKQKEKEQKTKFWNDTISGWKDGTIKKPAFVSDEMIPLLEGLGAEKGEAILSDIIKASKQNPNTTMVTDKEAGKVYGVDKETGVKKWEMNITARESDEGTKAKVGNTTKGDEMAFAEMLPALRQSYINSQKDPAAAAKLQQIMSMLEDPMKAGQARTMLLGYATPELQAQFRKRSNQIAASLNAGKGYPEPDVKETPNVKQDVTTKKKVDMNKLRSVGIELKNKLGRPATPEELRDAYKKAVGGK